MTEQGGKVVLLAEDFSSYPATEHMDASYLKALGMGAEQLGPWRQSSRHYAWRSERTAGRPTCLMPWRLVERDGRRWLEQPESFFNVVLTAGDDAWEDYVLEVDLAVEGGPAGPVVRYRTSRRNYWVRFEAGRPVGLLRRDQDDHALLASAPGCMVEAGRVYSCRVACDGPRIEVAVDGRTVISVEDDAWARGAVALRTEGPARFASVRVSASGEEAARLESSRRRRAVRVTSRRASAPAAKLLRTVALPPAAKVVHLRDVNDDGRLEIVACDVVVPELEYIRLARLWVLDEEGRELWSFGEPIEGRFGIHGSFAFNTADIDGDGRTEILVTHNFEILVLDGATGRVKKRAPAPLSFRGQEDHYERMVGDGILVCNLRGLAGPRDLILKDRYRNLWAFTGDLEPLWHRHVNMGHYIRARDVNGDGKDEVMAGYSLLAPDGHRLWSVPGGDPDHNRYPGPEHVDSVLIERFGPDEDAPLRIAAASSDLGFLLLDVEGRVLAQRRVGHAQRLGAARFRPDLPGRQFAVQTAWGNYHILDLFDAEGLPLLTRERPDGGVHPVNWMGDGGALMRFARGLADGNFDVLVDLPAGPSACPPAYDADGDGVDEVFIVQGDKLCVYGPETRPARPVAPHRPSLTNWDRYGGFYL